MEECAADIVQFPVSEVEDVIPAASLDIEARRVAPAIKNIGSSNDPSRCRIEPFQRETRQSQKFTVAEL